jgi:hypothetical protein
MVANLVGSPFDRGEGLEYLKAAGRTWKIYCSGPGREDQHLSWSMLPDETQKAKFGDHDLFRRPFANPILLHTVRKVVEEHHLFPETSVIIVVKAVSNPSQGRHFYLTGNKFADAVSTYSFSVLPPLPKMGVPDDCDTMLPEACSWLPIIGAHPRVMFDHKDLPTAPGQESKLESSES